MEVDNLLGHIGKFGKHQALTLILLGIVMAIVAANNMSYVFIAEEPKYRCYIENCDSQNSKVNEEWVNFTIPTKNGVPEHCLKFKTINEICNRTSFDQNKTEQCKKWIYQEKNIVEDFDIPCTENEWKLYFVGTIQFIGMVIGSNIFGYISDRIGRKTIMIVCIAIMSIFGSFEVLSSTYTVFILLRLFCAIGTSGIYPIILTFSMELVKNNKRELVWMFMTSIYATGQACISLIACYSENWVFTQLIISFPVILCCSYYFIIPESFLWLLAKKKMKRAKKVYIKILKFNKMEISEDDLKFFDDYIKEENGLKKKSFENIRKLMMHCKLILRYLLLFFLFINSSIVYYGLSNDSVLLNGDKHLNFALVSLVEILGNVIGCFVIKFLGRRIPLLISFVLCSIMCGASKLVPNDLKWLQIVLFLVGKFSITSSFYILFIWMAELLPTVLRAAGVGFATTGSGVGAMIASFIPYLKKLYWFLPIFFYSGLPFFSAFLIFLIPETFHKQLPQTVEDALNI